LQGLPQGAQQTCHCEPAEGGDNNFPISVIARLSVRKAVAIYPLCHCEPAKGGRGNLLFCHCEASHQGSRGNLVFQEKKDCKIKSLEKRLPRLNANAFRLAMTKGEGIASLLAMTEGTDPKVCHCEPAEGGGGNLYFLKIFP